MHLAPPTELTSLVSPWPFAWWGIDLLGPFPKAVGQLKYLVVVIDYSTKWIEAEPGQNHCEERTPFLQKEHPCKIRSTDLSSIRQ